ncbi:uncharacterized protein MEPE_02662 [Melanopsichium pennsylvanicum]|uniref:Uncharacterized protein n=1 Tax=Melanopsichium pennsylvanicum TaxID=63383 RepID=A0AAJ5C4X8_9BASI|nr:uncharacterized protein MEPE_02662 [Melanopsichium pennsylvanicum]
MPLLTARCYSSGSVQHLDATTRNHPLCGANGWPPHSTAITVDSFQLPSFLELRNLIMNIAHKIISSDTTEGCLRKPDECSADPFRFRSSESLSDRNTYPVALPLDTCLLLCRSRAVKLLPDRCHHLSSDRDYTLRTHQKHNICPIPAISSTIVLLSVPLAATVIWQEKSR